MNKYEFGVNPLWNELLTYAQSNHNVDNVIKGEQIDIITQPGKSSEVDNFLRKFGCKSLLKDKYLTNGKIHTYQRFCKCGDMDVAVTVIDREILRK